MSKLGRCPDNNKVMFRTRQQAIRAAMKASTRSGTPIRMYRCPACSHVHLTKKPERRAA